MTALTVTAGLNVNEAEVEAICRLTRLQYIHMQLGHSPPVHHLSNLYNLTTLSCGQHHAPPDWTRVLAPLTALQHVQISRLVTHSFTSQHRSTLTHLAQYCSASPDATSDQSHVFDLTALQHLCIDISPDPAMHVKFNQLQKLTSLTLYLDLVKAKADPDLESLFWTTLTHLSRLRLPKKLEGRLVSRTKQLMPLVHIISQ
jgi:hypothetical protein